MGFVNGNDIEDEDYYLEINICINVFDLNRLINNIDDDNWKLFYLQLQK